MGRRRLLQPVSEIAYFSMEVALQSEMPTYAGGLGVLAGDTLRGAADLGIPLVGLSLLHRKGYFFQRFDEDGRQLEDPVAWSPDDWLRPVEAGAHVEVEARTVRIRAWRYDVASLSGGVVPVFLLDTDLPENDPQDRRLTDHLYGGDDRYRLAQEVVLGIGGVRMLRALGLTALRRFHMNEGHSALLALELLDEEARAGRDAGDAAERVRRRCVFTTHTPVPAGHDRFPLDLAERVLGRERCAALETLGCFDSELNLTLVALELSRYVNGVAGRHSEVSRSMFPGYTIHSITNGVHAGTWTSPPFAALFDRYLADWRRDPLSLRYALTIPRDAVWHAHLEAKRELIHEANERANAGFDRDVFTIGFARRATAYKRPTLLFRDAERLRGIAAAKGPIQIVVAGKAHPRDEAGKALLQEIGRRRADLEPEVKVAVLANYDLELAQRLTAGVDLWLNTPKPPHEASGTSGMKAAFNGVPSLSTLDGWWIEGHVEDVTGWKIGPGDPRAAAARSDDEDARDLYEALERRILPLYYGDPSVYAQVMRSTIAVNASFFNTHRMLQEYGIMAYGPAPVERQEPT